jgi:hypothetical protein
MKLAQEDAKILAMSTAELRAECRAEGIDPDGVVADMDAATTKALLSVLHTTDLLAELIRRLNYDGHDLDSLTIGEMRRAL